MTDENWNGVLRPDMPREVSTQEIARANSPQFKELITTCKDAGYEYRGDWCPRRHFKYKKRDMVNLGKVRYVCQEDHDSDEGTKPGVHYFWKKWG